MGKKLSIEEQINEMKKRGIKFEIMSEDAAKKYLENNTYYFKLKAYEKAFEVYRTTEKAGQYVNLDFAYLRELANIDMHLRHFIIMACLDIEHTFKTRLVNDCTNSECDGFQIMQDFFAENTDVYGKSPKDKIESNRGSKYCAGLVDHHSEKWALWNSIELMSFGTFVDLYSRFYREYPKGEDTKTFTHQLRNIAKLRNAAAHNNCLLSHLNEDDVDRKKDKVASYVINMDVVGKKLRKSSLKKFVVYDFVTLLYVIDLGLEDGNTKRRILKELNHIINERAVEHADYFSECETIELTYSFIRKVVDKILRKHYIISDE